MRIVIDLQGAQSKGSRGRGIGRYTLSLARGLARNRGRHELFIVLNGMFPESIESIRSALADCLPRDAFKVWAAQSPVAFADAERIAYRKAAELIREAFIASLEPDVVLLSSLFEGLSDDAVTSVPEQPSVPTAVVLYDLIPLIHRKHYLSDPLTETWYRLKLEHLQRADAVLSISASSGDEAVRHLAFPPERVTNISAACDDHFQPSDLSEQQLLDLRDRFGISSAYIMYTGGIDHRKNVEAIITAYSQLPPSLRAVHQLVLVCSIRPEDCDRLTRLGKQLGLMRGQLVLTGFVSDPDLLTLYNGCHLFVFPSWHEGFGLPALEAMRCARPVLAANTSSLPEVVGFDEALFDPHDSAKITEKLEQGLTDTAFRLRLVTHGVAQAARFSWDRTAQAALGALERLVETSANNGAAAAPAPAAVPRRRLAYVSPLPPGRSGISDYSAELLPALSRWYDIDVVVDQEVVSCLPLPAGCTLRDVAWLRQEHAQCDRVLYHFGNSTFHSHMFELVEAIPGVVVLHDFYLSGIYAHREWHQLARHCWTDALMTSHGYAAVQHRFTEPDGGVVVQRYPCNLPVLQAALGIIVHSRYACLLAANWYGKGCGDDWDVVPLLRQPAHKRDKAQARHDLGLPADAYIICSFGHVESTKLGHRLTAAFNASEPGQTGDGLLIFVGACGNKVYAEAIEAAKTGCRDPQQIRITGWVDTETYQAYLAAADVGVQLRTQSRGETSAAALDCMNYGLATVVNAHGGMAELSKNAVWQLPDEFSDKELTTALNALWADTALRSRIGAAAQALLSRDHAPVECASRYAEAIERAYAKAEKGLHRLVPQLAAVATCAVELAAFAQSAARSFPPRPRLRQCLVLVNDAFRNGPKHLLSARLKAWIEATPRGWLLEPVYLDAIQTIRYARKWACAVLGVPAAWAWDTPVDAWHHDFVLRCSQSDEEGGFSLQALQTQQALTACGAAIFESPSLDSPDADSQDIFEFLSRLGDTGDSCEGSPNHQLAPHASSWS